MSTAPPRVSVGLPVYNGAKYLPQALTALLQQDFEDFELIICDNASTDATGEICLDFAARDRRVRYSRNDANIGLAANHNRTFLLSRGQFFKWAAHDDDFPRAMLQRFVSVFDEAPPDVSVVYSRCEYINADGVAEWIDSDHVDKDDPSPHRRLAWLLDNIHMYNCPYGLIRSDLLRKTRLYGLYPMSDHVLFAELAVLGKFVEIGEPLLRIRRHPGRTFTVTRDPKTLRELFRPGHGHKFTLLSMKTRMELELIRAIAAAPLPLTEKMPCVAIAAFVPQWRTFKAFGGRQKRKLFQKWRPDTASPSNE
jgi:glycosyltransferase involved in cell wall biosynthesis